MACTGTPVPAPQLGWGANVGKMGGGGGGSVPVQTEVSKSGVVYLSCGSHNVCVMCVTGM